MPGPLAKQIFGHFLVRPGWRLIAPTTDPGSTRVGRNPLALLNQLLAPNTKQGIHDSRQCQHVFAQINGPERRIPGPVKKHRCGGGPKPGARRRKQPTVRVEPKNCPQEEPQEAAQGPLVFGRSPGAFDP